jgi:hypothetical protein
MLISPPHIKALIEAVIEAYCISRCIIAYAIMLAHGQAKCAACYNLNLGALLLLVCFFTVLQDHLAYALSNIFYSYDMAKVQHLLNI